jgi:hypothetical protein
MKKKNIPFDSWLGEEGIREEVTATAIRRISPDRWKQP